MQRIVGLGSFAVGTEVSVDASEGRDDALFSESASAKKTDFSVLLRNNLLMS
jgi:hypothetical protein